MKKSSVLVILLAAGWAWAAASNSLYINGKKAAHPLLVQGGLRYVCVDDLRAAGAQVTSQPDGLSLRFKPDSGGANQVQAVEGRKGEWLFNGIWRVKCGDARQIRKPFSGEPGTPGWGLEMEVRNGSDKEVTLAQTGVGLPTLALGNGTVLKADEGDWQQICFRPILAGASVSHQVKFYFPHGTPDSAALPGLRLVVPIDVKSGLLRDTGLHYSAPAPNFRVDVK